MTRKIVMDFIKRTSGTPRQIYIPFYLLDICGDSYDAAVLMNQILFWSDDPHRRKDGWYAAPYEKIKKDLRLSKFRVMGAMKILSALGVETKSMISPRHKYTRVVHYRVNEEIFMGVIEAYLKTEDSTSWSEENEFHNQMWSEENEFHEVEFLDAVNTKKKREIEKGEKKLLAAASASALTPPLNSPEHGDSGHNQHSRNSQNLIVEGNESSTRKENSTRKPTKTTAKEPPFQSCAKGFPPISLPNKGVFLCLQNAYASITVHISNGKIEVAGDGSADSVFAKMLERKELPPTTHLFLLNMVKTWHNSILSQPKKELHLFEISEEWERRLKDLGGFLPQSEIESDSVFSISLVTNREQVWGGTVKIVAHTTTTTHSLMLIVSFLGTREDSTLKAISESFAQIATAVEATTFNTGKTKISPLSAPRKQSALQSENAALVDALGEAWGIKATPADYGLYIKKAQKLVSSIPVEKFKAFCDRQKVKAGDYADKLTIATITENGRISEFVQWEENERVKAEKRALDEEKFFQAYPDQRPGYVPEGGYASPEKVEALRALLRSRGHYND